MYISHILCINVCDIHVITCIAHISYAAIIYNSVSQSNGLKNYFSLQITKTEIQALFIEIVHFNSSLNFSFLSKLNYFHYTFTSLHQMVLWIFLIFCLKTWDLNWRRRKTKDEFQPHDKRLIVTGSGQFEELKSNTLWNIPTCWFNSFINSVESFKNPKM